MVGQLVLLGPAVGVLLVGSATRPRPSDSLMVTSCPLRMLLAGKDGSLSKYRCRDVAGGASPPKKRSHASKTYKIVDIICRWVVNSFSFLY